MPSLTVDVLLCVILLGGAYILFGRQGASTAASTSAGKKKKRSKASKGAKSQAPQSDNSGKGTNGVDHIKSSKAQAKASNDRSSATASAQATRQVPAQVNHVRQSEEAEEEDFPPLFSSTSLKSVKAPLKQIPLAERLAKPRPKTAVDDMVEKDDEWQGQTIYSRTMRIVKPQDTEPLLLDEKDDEDWEKPAREQAEDSAWQSVPVASKKSSTIRIATTSSQPLPPTAARSIPGLTEQTKKQRQNARKAAELKAAKEEAEHERLQRLAAHKRVLERERMEEQNKPKGRQPAPQAQKTKREDVGGGMRAAVHDGKLIWE